MISIFRTKILHPLPLLLCFCKAFANDEGFISPQYTVSKMVLHLFSLNVNENWIDLELNRAWRNEVVIKYNDEPVITEKLGFSSTEGEFEFIVLEEGTEVRYFVQLVLENEVWRTYVTRNGNPLLVTYGNPKKIRQQKTVASTVICYEVKGRRDWVEVPFGMANFSSSGVYCFVDVNRDTIYLWLGSKASYYLKLVGDGVAHVLRNRFGHDFRIKEIEEGMEPSVFKNLFQ